MVETAYNSSFPTQVGAGVQTSSMEFGASVGRAIESEWFKKESGYNRFYSNRESFHNLRLYARGEQSIRKYKDELSTNGDLSYLNLDWKPVPIIPKFVDIVVNGMSDRSYKVKAYATDPSSVKKRTEYLESIMRDMAAKDFIQELESQTGFKGNNHDLDTLPENNEELEVHMQMEYKQGIEIAEEEAIQSIFDKNKYELIRRRLNYDLTVLGIACVKNSFNKAEGITLRYVDPADLVYSYTESPYFDDVYYVGEVRRISINELKKEYPHLTEEDIKQIVSESSGRSRRYRNQYSDGSNEDSNTVEVLYFEYKTYMDQVYKVKKTSTGGDKAIQKDGTFNPPETEMFEKVSRSIEVLYTGAKIIGSKGLLEWKLAKNMTRPKSDTTKVEMSYNIVAPRMYKGRIESLVGRCIGFADMIQITHLKLQQVLSKMVPDGVYLDADGLMEVDLGNGTNYNPAEALNMYFQTGSVVGRSMTIDGDLNHGKIPITELSTNGGGQKIQSLITTYNYYMQMIRDVTGLNEARDGSTPDKDALVGVQKLAAANSNTATRHILQSNLYLTLKTAECIMLRISDCLEYSPTRDSLIQSLGRFNVGILEDLKDLHTHDFGIFIELAPDEEEKQMLENNIQQALGRDQIYLEDAIDVREIKNIKLANQVLKIRRKRKIKQEQEQQAAMIQQQSEANIQQSQAAAEADMQKKQVEAQTKGQLAQMQSELDIKKMQMEAQMKKELMQFEFELNLQLEEMRMKVIKEKEEGKEDRKDERTKIQASQQSKLIDQRKNNLPPKDFQEEDDEDNFLDSFGQQEFESSGNDSMSGFGTEQFAPR